MPLRVDRANTEQKGNKMNINFNNIGVGTGTFGIGQMAEGQKVESKKAEASHQDLRFSGVQAFDPLQGSEPVTNVPAAELSREDDLGKLVSSAFNLPPPPMPNFNV